MRSKTMCPQFGWCWATVALTEDAPYLTDVSYLMPPIGCPSCRLHHVASQDLAAALYLHKQYTIGDTHAIIFVNQILHKVYRLDQ
jgi:hypothetical protein